jgi:hypothetical protein
VCREEALQRALELQKKLKEERELREKQEMRDRERARIEQSRLALDTQERLLDEQRRRDIEQLKKEKDQREEHARQLREQLRLDYIDRFGHSPPRDSSASADGPKLKKPKDQVIHCVNILRSKYMTADPRGLLNCLNTLVAYLKNIASDPSEAKYHRIRTSNKVFVERVGPFEGARALLVACGFKEGGEFLEIPGGLADGWLCGQAVKYLELLIGQL